MGGGGVAGGRSVSRGRKSKAEEKEKTGSRTSFDLPPSFVLGPLTTTTEEGSAGGATALSDNPILPFRIPRLNPPLVSANNPLLFSSFFLSAIFALGMQ